jgi:hypothetical protein
MGYYRGDYYRGDYYRGDPGFLSFLGGAAKAIGGFIPGVGPLIEAGGAALSKIGKPSTALIKAPGAVSGTLAKLKGGVLKHPVLTGAGAAGLAGAGAIAATELLGRHKKKHRRMNVYNPRALRRAVRRSLGFAKMAKRVIHIEKRFKNPRRWGHMGHFTKKRKKK